MANDTNVSANDVEIKVSINKSSDHVIKFNFLFQEKEKEILYLQSELESAVQEKSALKCRLNHLENVQISNAKTIESLNFEVENLKKNKIDEARGNEKEIFEVSSKIKEKILVTTQLCTLIVNSLQRLKKMINDVMVE